MPQTIRRAMVLAAGYGVRLRPLTDQTPKPLVPVAGRPMIEYALDHLRRCGIEEIVINVSHLKEQMAAYAAALRGFTVHISEEAEPLETGGGLKRALPFFRDEPFFTINSDIIWLDEGRPALEELAARWDDAAMDVLLLAQPKATAVGYGRGEDDLFIQPENTPGWRAADAPYIVAGVGIIHPRIFARAPDGKFSVKVLWAEAMRRGRLFCVPHRGRWFQTGTVADIGLAERELQTPPPGPPV